MVSEEMKRIIEMIPQSAPFLEPSYDSRRMSLDFIGLAMPDVPGAKYSEVDVDGVKGEWIEFDEFDSNGLTMLYLHGGGYCSGSITSHRKLAANLGKSGHIRRSLIVDYKLAPENPFPMGLSDCARSFEYLSNEIDCEKILVAGDSAGGGMSLALTVDRQLKGLNKPDMLFLMSPWTDLTISGESIARNKEIDPMLRIEDLNEMSDAYAGGRDKTDVLMSPLFANVTEFPPTYIQVGSREIVLDDSLRLKDKLEGADVDVKLDVFDDMFHVFQMCAMLAPEPDDALLRFGAWVKEKMGN